MKSQRIQALSRFYDRMGLIRNKVEVRESDKGLSLYSTQLIPARTAFAVIPFDRLINHTNLLKKQGFLYDILRNYEKQLMELGDHMSLIIWCMHCMTTQQYSQWFDVDCSTFLKMTREQINSCQDERLKMEYMVYRQECQRQYQFILKITQHLFDDTNLWETYRRASDFVTTRGFGYRMKETALIPLFDCMNHSFTNCINLTLVNTQQCEQFDVDLSLVGIHNKLTEPQEQQSEGSYDFSDYEQIVDNRQYPAMTHVVLATNQVIHPNTQITLFYGCRNNNYLLKWYGFAVPNNPYDSVHLYLGQDAINFDGIDRPNTMIKLKNKLSIDLINQSRKHFYQQYYKKPFKGLFTIPKQIQYQLYFLRQLLKMMDRCHPPKGIFQPIGIMQHVKTYQQQQNTIYNKQIGLLQELVKWLEKYGEGCGVPSKLAAYCRSFIIQQS